MPSEKPKRSPKVPTRRRSPIPNCPVSLPSSRGSSLYAGCRHRRSGRFHRRFIRSHLCTFQNSRPHSSCRWGEGLWCTESTYLVFNLKGALAFSRPRLKRSKLSVRDTQLDSHFKHYMEQEILGSPANMDQILRYYFRSPREDAIAAIFEERKDECKESADALANLSEKFGDESLKSGMEAVFTATVLGRRGPQRVAAAGRLPEARGNLHFRRGRASGRTGGG